MEGTGHGGTRLRTLRRGERSWMLSGLAGLGLTLALLAPGTASAAADLTWSGESHTTEDWSEPINWSGASAPGADQSLGTLTFPRLARQACIEGREPCYISFNDVSGLSAEQLSIDDQGEYFIGGRLLDLGAQGLSATPASGSSEAGGAVLLLPLALTAPQRWLDAGDGTVGDTELLFAPEAVLSGPAADSLTVELSDEGAFYLDNDTNVGPLTIRGANPAQAGVFNGYVGLLPAEVNATDDQAVRLEHVLMIGRGGTGPLQTEGATLDVGGGAVPGDLAVASAQLDPASEAVFEITSTGTSAGIDYSQITASGPVALESAHLRVQVGGEACPTLTTGETFTLVTTSASLSGAFAGLPEGAELPTQPRAVCGTATRELRVSYRETGTGQSVTATVQPTALEREAAQQHEREVTREQELRHEAELAHEHELAGLHTEALEREARERAAVAAAEARRHEEEAQNAVAGFKVAAVPDATLAATSLEASASGTLTVHVSCPAGETSCSGTITLRTLQAVSAGRGPRPSIVTLATGSFSVGGGQKRTVTLHLTRAARALLARLHTLHARATLVAHDPAGASHTTRTVVVLRASGRRG